MSHHHKRKPKPSRRPINLRFLVILLIIAGASMLVPLGFTAARQWFEERARAHEEAAHQIASGVESRLATIACYLPTVVETVVVDTHEHCDELRKTITEQDRKAEEQKRLREKELVKREAEKIAARKIARALGNAETTCLNRIEVAKHTACIIDLSHPGAGCVLAVPQ